MKVLVIGKNGQLGKSIHKIVSESQSNCTFFFVGREEIDLSYEKSITNYFKNNHFDYIINCAAYTLVDKAESESELANKINHLAVKKIAEIANDKNSKLLHISTDYVFDGKNAKPYLETDKVNPINTYGASKLAGERAVFAAMSINAIIIRTSWIYSEYGNNFVDSILTLGRELSELNIVNDQIGTPTYAGDLAKFILYFIEQEDLVNKSKETQIYHYSNEGFCSWFEFAKEIIELAGINCIVQPIKTSEYQTEAKRPINTVLSKNKIYETIGINIPDWKNSLKNLFDELKG